MKFLIITGMPPKVSFLIILCANFLFNVSFFVIVPTATAYAKHLGGNALFSGLTIGVVTLSSFVLLIPLSRISMLRDFYRPTLDLASWCLCLGNVLYALADKAGSLYLTLIGRIVSGIGFTGWFFVKRYCTDPRFVGINKRTMCTSLLVFAQTLGMAIGPILGGQLARVPWHTELLNKYTIPGWFMAIIWIIFWVLSRAFFQDVEAPTHLDDVEQDGSISPLTKDLLNDVTLDGLSNDPSSHGFTKEQLIVCCLMSYSAFLVFFELGSWESSIPIYALKKFGYSEWQSGNFIGFIGLGSVLIVAAMPFLAHALQDRMWLLLGFGIGTFGIFINFSFLEIAYKMELVNYGIQWFLTCGGFNVASSITLSLLSKNLSDRYTDTAALIVQLSNYIGRLVGATWGTAGSHVGDSGIAMGQLVVALLGIVAMSLAWHLLEAQKG